MTQNSTPSESVSSVMQSSTPMTLLTSVIQSTYSNKSSSASKREKMKSKQKIQTSRKEILRLKRMVWKLQKRLSSKSKKKEEKNAIYDERSPEGFANKTMSCPKSNRKALLAHFTLLNTLSNSTTKKKWERRYIGQLVKKIANKYRGLKTHLLRYTRVHHETVKRAAASKDLQYQRRKKLNMDELEVFLNRDDNSRLTSGRKEVISRNGTKNQIRYYNFSVQILYQKFLSENPEILISKSSFYLYLKKFPHIKIPSANNRDQCLCKQCTNMQLLADALYSNKIITTRDKHTLARNVVCSIDNFDCTHRQCTSCVNNSPIDTTKVKASVITYYQWETSPNESSVTCQKKVNSAVGVIKMFEDQLSQYAGHYFRVCHQFSEIQHVRTNVSETELILHIDYSENYMCKWANEIQSAHFGNSHKQIVIHQGVMYRHNQEPISFATISDDLRKTSEAVAAHVSSVLSEVQITRDSFHDRLTLISDSPSSQYRNRFSIYLMLQVCKKFGIKEFTWIYTESGHGKGAPDGVGAALKRLADNEVAYGKSVLNANDLSVLARKSKILVKTVTADEINAFSETIQLAKSGLPAMKGISKAHQVISNVESDIVSFKDLACHCDTNVCTCYNLKHWHPKVNVKTVSSYRSTIPTKPDGRCFFRSIVIGQSDELQLASRDSDGEIIDPILCVSEQLKADSLRNATVQYMANNVQELIQFEEGVNVDLPQHLVTDNVTLADRIKSMSIPTTPVGEFEITCTAEVLKRPIHILHSNDSHVIKYKDDKFSNASPLFVLYMPFGDNSGHYECVNTIAEVVNNQTVRKNKKSRTKKIPASESWYCFICDENLFEDMIQCLKCEKWVHEGCAGSEGCLEYVCPQCKDYPC